MFWTWEKTYTHTHTHTICSRSCRTTIIELHFEICPWVMVHSWHYRLLERCLNYSERIGWYAGDSHSAWCSPTVFVVKNDGSIRYWLSYHKFNEVSQFDTYPVPLVGKLLNRLDTACFFLNAGFDQGLLEDSLVSRVKRKNDLLHSIQIIPICDTLVQPFQRPGHFPASHGLCTAWCHHP